jgi:hypothetical protein
VALGTLVVALSDLFCIFALHKFPHCSLPKRETHTHTQSERDTHRHRDGNSLKPTRIQETVRLEFMRNKRKNN